MAILVNMNNRIDLDNMTFWVNPDDSQVNALITFNNKLTRLRAEMLVINGNKILLCKENDKFALPGGSFDINETPEDAARRECQEEAHIDTVNVQWTPYDYCECFDELEPWVAENVPEEYQWYNYYTCLCIGDYAGEYTGDVAKIDEDSTICNSKQWYKIADIVNDKDFKTPWKNALIKYGYLPNTNLTEDFNSEIKERYWYHGSYTDQIIEFNSTINWLTTNKQYASCFGSVLYQCSVDPKNILIIGKTDTKIYNAIPATMPYEFSSEFLTIIKKLHLTDLDELTEELDRLAAENYYDHYGYTMPIHTFIRSGYCARKAKELGYDSIFTVEFGTNSLGVLDPTIITIISKTLTEATRNQITVQSKNNDIYKHNIRGKNRWERKKYSKVATQVKSYNQINMNDFFKKDLLTVTIPVTGETNNYEVQIQMEGVVAEIAKNIKSNGNKFEYRTVIQALTKIFNTANLKVKCSCDDFKYRFQHALIISNDNIDGSDKDPGAGTTGMADTKSKGCKHILLAIANQDWLMKVASVIHNYTIYAETNMKAAFDKLIFPKLYGVPIDAADEVGLVDEGTDLSTDKHTIETINEYAKNKGKFKKGENKNPVKGSGKLDMEKIKTDKEAVKKDEPKEKQVEKTIKEPEYKKA